MNEIRDLKVGLKTGKFKLSHKKGISMHAYSYQIVIVKEGKKYWAYIPDLPGVYGLGNTPAQAKKDITQALTLYIEDILADGKAVPESTAKVVSFDSIEIAVED